MILTHRRMIVSKFEVERKGCWDGGRMAEDGYLQAGNEHGSKNLENNHHAVVPCGFACAD